jgi:hypothetical protein
MENESILMNKLRIMVKER